ncbi:sigma-70 family RNA polymerase sigma factor [Endozoicomonas ascidiicola]|uniref:sigma-70 family RNA polymerase sigma factor n=1 Tax=Endozoicomonas ascidiicola TaxID=1698521 RepID=UPI000831D2C4|nr:sigma-70 family RNA polymerase sigma factor [Endozoicomonas ascidiicola]
MNAWTDNEKSLHGWLLKQTGDPDLSKDLLQDVFLKSLEHRERFCTLEHAKSWLFTITRNTLIDASRKSSRIDRSAIVPDIDLEDPEMDEPVLMKLEHCMLRVLTELKDTDRDIIEHCDIQKMPQDVYTHKASLSLPATKARLQRARQKLREKMVNACKIQFDETGVSDFTPRR